MSPPPRPSGQAAPQKEPDLRPLASGGRGVTIRGVTIIELLIVIFIVMILAGLAAPVMGRGIMQSRMNSAAAQAVTALKAARNRAITKGRVHCAAFDTINNPNVIVTWEIVDEGVGIPADFDALDALRDGSDPNPQKDSGGGATLAQGTVIDSPLQRTFIAFMPDGSAWGPGMVTPQQFWVKPDADHDVPGTLDERRIVVGSLSGSVSIMR